MEFRLVYDGPLKASSQNNRRQKDKHDIRKQFHKQLVVLWEQHPMLNYLKHNTNPEQHYMKAMREEGHYFADPNVSIMETFARRFSRCGFRFVPLVNKQYKLVCGLDILLLRRENPGELIRSGGDLDNRVKTLFDALRIPSNDDELPRGCLPEPDEDPFFCLLEDDILVTELKVTTDRLLSPPKNEEGKKTDVVLVVHVKVKTTDTTLHNLSFSS